MICALGQGGWDLLTGGQKMHEEHASLPYIFRTVAVQCSIPSSKCASADFVGLDVRHGLPASLHVGWLRVHS